MGVCVRFSVFLYLFYFLLDVLQDNVVSLTKCFTTKVRVSCELISVNQFLSTDPFI